LLLPLLSILLGNPSTAERSVIDSRNFGHPATCVTFNSFTRLLLCEPFPQERHLCLSELEFAPRPKHNEFITTAKKTRWQQRHKQYRNNSSVLSLFGAASFKTSLSSSESSSSPRACALDCVTGRLRETTCVALSKAALSAEEILLSEICKDLIKQEIASNGEYNFTILRLYDATRNNSSPTTAKHDKIEELDVRD
jgi:hypothetical protein